jgi:guanine deaminase
MLERIVRGPLLVPRAGGGVAVFGDGALACDAAGLLRYVGDWRGIEAAVAGGVPVAPSRGVMIPPLVDVHTHVPQHPVRGRFIEGIPADAPGGRLLAGLRRNIFPAEAACDDAAVADRVVRGFLADTLSHGVVGGVSYMTPSLVATQVALDLLPDTWRVGLVLMDRHCPANLRTDPASLGKGVERLVEAHGDRLVITDRFAVTSTAPLRRLGAELARRHGLRTQTHLNEQPAEKRLVEQELDPEAGSYTHVYLRDGLLDHRCILAHCIQMRDDEWRVLRDTASSVAHCPTSNLLLGSGRMPLEAAIRFGVPVALGTDVGASPTVSMLAEMARFVAVHAGHCDAATPTLALHMATRSAAAIAGIDGRVGRLEVGAPMSFIEVAVRVQPPPAPDADDMIRAMLPDDLASPAPAVRRVTVAGGVVHEAADRKAVSGDAADDGGAHEAGDPHGQLPPGFDPPLHPRVVRAQVAHFAPADVVLPRGGDRPGAPLPLEPPRARIGRRPAEVEHPPAPLDRPTQKPVVHPHVAVGRGVAAEAARRRHLRPSPTGVVDQHRRCDRRAALFHHAQLRLIGEVAEHRREQPPPVHRRAQVPHVHREHVVEPVEQSLPAEADRQARLVALADLVAHLRVVALPQHRFVVGKVPHHERLVVAHRGEQRRIERRLAVAQFEVAGIAVGREVGRPGEQPVGGGAIAADDPGPVEVGQAHEVPPEQSAAHQRQRQVARDVAGARIVGDQRHRSVPEAVRQDVEPTGVVLEAGAGLGGQRVQERIQPRPPHVVDPVDHFHHRACAPLRPGRWVDEPPSPGMTDTTVTTAIGATGDAL